MKDFKEIVLEQAGRHSSFYIYDERQITDSIRKLKQAFPQVKFLYSVKANPLDKILKTVSDEGLGFDAASPAEVLMGEKLGLASDMIYYSAPGKTRCDIVDACEKSVVIADSLHEVDMLRDVAAEKGRKLKIGLRVNPSFTLGSNRPVSSKFGIDEDILFRNAGRIKGYDRLEITGIHVHSRSQELDAGLLADYYENMMKLAVRVSQNLDIKLEFINMGGGLGIPYSRQDKPLDIRRLGEKAARIFAAYSRQTGGAQVIIESGRYIVGQAGIYVTTVLDKKVSGGKTYVILCNTLNGFIRPSLARMAENRAAVPPACEPLYTGRDAFRIKVLNDSVETEVVTLCGNLCTSADVVAADICLPKMNIGDVVAISGAGSYAAVLSPRQFASLTPPAQIFLSANGQIK